MSLSLSLSLKSISTSSSADKNDNTECTLEVGLWCERVTGAPGSPALYFRQVSVRGDLAEPEDRESGFSLHGHAG